MASSENTNKIEVLENNPTGSLDRANIVSPSVIRLHGSLEAAGILLVMNDARSRQEGAGSHILATSAIVVYFLQQI
jgi:hypothetical protein